MTHARSASGALQVAVYCSRCDAIVTLPDDRLFRAAQDHELDEHRDGYGETIYTNLGAVNA